jgi:hypothetical protein
MYTCLSDSSSLFLFCQELTTEGFVASSTHQSHQPARPSESLSWEQCRWIGNLYHNRLGGIDASYSSTAKGTNGSIAPQKTLQVLKALKAAAAAATDQGIAHTPLFIDAGASEGRALLHWAFLLSRQDGFDSSPIKVYGIELPHLRGYEEIHRTAEIFAERELLCPVNIEVIWKDCKNIESLSHEFTALSDNVGVVYSFWTVWFPDDKVKLLDLVAAEPNIKAISVYLSSQDKPYQGQRIGTDFILRRLCKGSADSTWTMYKSFTKCRFVGGAETVMAVVFSRTRSMNGGAQLNDRASDQEPHAPLTPRHVEGFAVLGLGPATEDGWLDICMECGGGGGG